MRLKQDKIQKAEDVLKAVEARLTLREAITSLEPTITKRHEMDGIPLDHLFKTVAKSLGASDESVSKWYYHLRSETPKKKDKRRTA
jgi:hypothetical protein